MTPLRPPSEARSGPVGISLALSAAVIIPTWIFFAMTTSYATWGIFPVMVGTAAITFPIVRYIARGDDQRWLSWALMLALVAKFVAALARYYVAFEIYGGSADAARYFTEGSLFAANLREGDWTYEPTRRGGEGTEVVRQITGIILVVIGDTRLGAFIFFAWMSFLGMLFFFTAFRLALPEGDYRHYALLLFFLPTMVYWPSSIGKEAWMLLTLGMATYGAARLYRQRRGGLILTVVGMLGAGVVRPHMAALLVTAVAVGFILRRSERPSLFGPFAKVVTTATVLALAIFAVQLAEESFGVEEGEGLSGVERVIDETADSTGEGGGSTFEAKPATNPIYLPLAILTVMFRPLPFEAHNFQALVSSLEGVFLLGLVVISRRRFRQAFRSVWRHPYVAFSVMFSLLFIIAFSSFGNFGLLARQRSQLFPMALVLFALPAYRAIRRRRSPVLVNSEHHATPDGCWLEVDLPVQAVRTPTQAHPIDPPNYPQGSRGPAASASDAHPTSSA